MYIRRRRALLLEDSLHGTRRQPGESALAAGSWEGDTLLGWEAPKVHFHSPYDAVGPLADMLRRVGAMEEDARLSWDVAYEAESLAHVLQPSLSASDLRQTLVLWPSLWEDIDDMQDERVTAVGLGDEAVAEDGPAGESGLAWEQGFPDRVVAGRDQEEEVAHDHV